MSPEEFFSLFRGQYAMYLIHIDGKDAYGDMIDLMETSDMGSLISYLCHNLHSNPEDALTEMYNFTHWLTNKIRDGKITL